MTYFNIKLKWISKKKIYACLLIYFYLKSVFCFENFFIGMEPKMYINKPPARRETPITAHHRLSIIKNRESYHTIGSNHGIFMYIFNVTFTFRISLKTFF